MCRQRVPLGNAACATRLVSSGAEGGSCRCNDIGALNWMRTLQSRKSGHDSTSLKLYVLRERLKRIWIRSSTNRSCARVAGRDSILRSAVGVGAAKHTCALGRGVDRRHRTRRFAGQRHAEATPSQIGPSQVPAGQGNTKRNILRTSNSPPVSLLGLGQCRFRVPDEGVVSLFQIRRQHFFDPFHECTDSARQIASMCYDWRDTGAPSELKIGYDLHKRSHSPSIGQVQRVAHDPRQGRRGQRLRRSARC